MHLNKQSWSLPDKGALFVVTIKPELFHDAGFAERFDSFGDRITGFEQVEAPIYGPGATGAHRDDRGLLVRFRKT